MEYNLKPNTILIVGAGELGSRHLQGLLKITLPTFIEVLDTNTASLDRCKLRASEVLHSTNILGISYHNDQSSISKEIDICIVATTSNVRLDVIRSIVGCTNIKYFILEKILFQNEADFEIASRIFKENNIKAWINCPRRTFKLYNNIKNLINAGDKITMSVLGGDWGLACNSIHFIDLFSYFTRTVDFEYRLSGITQITNSKRAGFYEFGGTIFIRNSNMSELILHSRLNNKSETQIQIITDKNTWFIDESNEEVKTYNENNGWKSNMQSFKMPFQSNLTNIYCEEILNNNNSILPEYFYYEEMHRKMILEFSKVFHDNNFSSSIGCPIT